MRIEVWRGTAAADRLGSPAFREQWDRLYADCPWASVFQSRGYAATWYDIYGSQFTPLLIGALNDAGDLCGLLPLALTSAGEPVAAGGRQAEYQVWIARPADGDAFIEAALERLSAEVPRKTLLLRYLPPNTPRGWLANRRGPARRCVLSVVRRGIMDIDEAETEAALLKKSNRRKLRALERRGAVAYERLTGGAAIDALLEEIVPLCDLRHGALFDVLPFQDDPLKLRFHQALARVPGVLCVSVLRCGSELVSAEVDADNRGQLALGFGALQPSAAKYSPGRMHLLFLARDMARSRHRSIDLTPGGTYKDLLAKRSDEVYTLQVLASGRQRAAWAVSAAARGAAKSLARSAGADPTKLRARAAALREALASMGEGSKAVRVLRLIKSRTWSTREMEFNELDDRSIAEMPHDTVLRADSLHDLVSYRQGVTDTEPRSAFLRRALVRLEHGSRAYTRVVNGDLVATAWMSVSSSSPPDAELASVIAPGIVVIHDLTAASAFQRPDEWARMLPQLLRDAAAITGTTRVLVAVPTDQSDVREAVHRLGGRHVGSVFTTVRGQRTKQWSTVTLAPRPPARTLRPAGAVG